MTGNYFWTLRGSFSGLSHATVSEHLNLTKTISPTSRFVESLGGWSSGLTNPTRKPASSLEQTEAVHSDRLDAGFVFTIAHIGRELAQLPVASLNLMLAAPKRHPLTKLKKLRLRDLSDAAFVWFPRLESPAYYDRLIHECFRGGLKSPHIVQEAVNEATILSLVSCRLGVAFVSSATRWRCPESVVVLPVTDLHLPLPLALIWGKDNVSPLLAKFVAEVRQLPEVETFTKH